MAQREALSCLISNILDLDGLSDTCKLGVQVDLQRHRYFELFFLLILIRILSMFYLSLNRLQFQFGGRICDSQNGA